MKKKQIDIKEKRKLHLLKMIFESISNEPINEEEQFKPNQKQLELIKDAAEKATRITH